MSSAVIITAAAIALIVLPPKYNPRLCSWLHGNVLARAGALGKDPLTESVEFHRALSRSQHLERALTEMRALLDLASASTSPLSRVHAVAIRLAVLRLRAAEDLLLLYMSPDREAEGPHTHSQGASGNNDLFTLPPPRAIAIAGASSSAPISSISTRQCWLQWVACEEGLTRLAELQDEYHASKNRLERFTKAARMARAFQEAGIAHLVCSAESALAIAVESYLRSKQQFIRGLRQAEAQQLALARGLIAVFTAMCLGAPDSRAAYPALASTGREGQPTAIRDS